MCGRTFLDGVPAASLPAVMGDVCCSLTPARSRRFVFGASCLWLCTFKGTDFLEIPRNALLCFPVKTLTGSVSVPLVTFNFYTLLIFLEGTAVLRCGGKVTEGVCWASGTRSRGERVTHQGQWCILPRMLNSGEGSTWASGFPPRHRCHLSHGLRDLAFLV